MGIDVEPPEPPAGGQDNRGFDASDVPTPNEEEPPRRQRHLQSVKPPARIPPHSLEAEESLLGAMLLKPEPIDQALNEGLTSGAFYKPSHGHIYDAIVALRGKGDPTDPVTVSTYLLEHGLMETVGGPSRLLTLQAATPATSNAWRYARTIVEHHRLRLGIANLGDAVERLYAFDQSAALAAVQRAVEANEETGGTHSWQPVDLQLVLDGDTLRIEPTMLARSDGQHLLYPGKIHAFNAEPESGKSFLALLACAEQIWRAQHVLYIDFEDAAEGIVERLLALDVTRDELLERFHYVRPDDPFDLAAQAHIQRLLDLHHPVLVVIDGVTEVMVLNGWSIKENDDVAMFYAALPKRIARSGAGVVLIDHVVKNKNERGKGGIGGQHKRAGIDGASYTLEVIKPFGRGLDGLVKLTVDKDRGGFVRPASVGGEHVADVRILSADLGGRVEVHIDVPDRVVDAGEYHGPTRCMDALSKFFHENPDEQLSKNQASLRLRAIGISYRDAVIGVALEQLAVNGVLTVAAGPRKSRLFQLHADKENDDDLALDM